MIVGYVWQILGRGASLPPPLHSWAAPKMPILNRVKVFIVSSMSFYKRGRSRVFWMWVLISVILVAWLLFFVLLIFLSCLFKVSIWAWIRLKSDDIDWNLLSQSDWLVCNGFCVCDLIAVCVLSISLFWYVCLVGCCAFTCSFYVQGLC